MRFQGSEPGYLVCALTHCTRLLSSYTAPYFTLTHTHTHTHTRTHARMHDTADTRVCSCSTSFGDARLSQGAILTYPPARVGKCSLVHILAST